MTFSFVICKLEIDSSNFDFKEMLYIDALVTKKGFKKSGSPFDNRQQAVLRVGDYKIVTGTTLLGGWYKPVSVEGKTII